MTMNVAWDPIGILLDRQAALNSIRVGAIEVYLIVVTGGIALLAGMSDGGTTLDKDLLLPLTLCLLLVGVLVFLFDLCCRARAYAVAVEVVRQLADPELDPMPARPKFRIDEDLAFSTIVMVVNSTVVYIGVDKLLLPHVASYVLLPIAVSTFIIQFAAYYAAWPRLASRCSPWPDGFVSTRGKTQRPSPPGSEANTEQHRSDL